MNAGLGYGGSHRRAADQSEIVLAAASGQLPATGSAPLLIALVFHGG